MTAYTKSVLRIFKNNKLKFLLSFSIIFISVALTCGISFNTGTVTKSYEYTLNQYNTSDLIVKSKSPIGFSTSYYEYLDNKTEILDKDAYFTNDYICVNNDVTRVYYRDLNSNVNKLALKEGNMPTNAFEVLSDSPQGKRIGSIGDKIDFSINLNGTVVDFQVTVVGIINSGLYSSTAIEPYIHDSGKSVNRIIYFSNEFDFGSIPSSYIPNNETAIKLFNEISLSDSFFKKVRDFSNTLDKDLVSENIAVLSIEDNVSVFIFLQSKGDIQNVGIISAVFFGLVSAMIAAISISRLITDERSIIGCYLCLGYSRGQVAFKYLLFSITEVLLGDILGTVVGIFALFPFARNIFEALYDLGPLTFNGTPMWTIIECSGILVITLFFTFIDLFLAFKEDPINLFRPKAPPIGRKTIIEKIGWLWKKLSFKWKYCIRNVTRYLKNTFLMIASVASSIFLILLGFSLYDNAISLSDNSFFANCLEPVRAVTIVLASSGCILAGIIIFNLLSMNIEDRRREIAVLKALGFNDRECLRCMVRETSIASILGIAVGLPISYGICYFTIELIEFGHMYNVKWYTYLIAVFLPLTINVIVNEFLYGKIGKISIEEASAIKR